ncbi:MAG: hypothetical protein LWX56_07830 [Ignavibacteria bacterium]|nr:hypothetical protein [Ignavibacteria bacterium]
MSFSESLLFLFHEMEFLYKGLFSLEILYGSIIFTLFLVYILPVFHIKIFARAGLHISAFITGIIVLVLLVPVVNQNKVYVAISFLFIIYVNAARFIIKSFSQLNRSYTESLLFSGNKQSVSSKILRSYLQNCAMELVKQLHIGILWLLIVTEFVTDLHSGIGSLLRTVIYIHDFSLICETVFLLVIIFYLIHWALNKAAKRNIHSKGMGNSW